MHNLRLFVQSRVSPSRLRTQETSRKEGVNMAIPWPPQLNDLIDLLADLYTEPDSARLIVRRIGLNPAFIAFDGAAINIWMRVVQEANKHDKVGDLIAVAKQDYPTKVAWDVLKEQLDRSMMPAVPPRSWEWKASYLSAADWEVITGGQPTFLPIS